MFICTWPDLPLWASGLAQGLPLLATAQDVICLTRQKERAEGTKRTEILEVRLKLFCYFFVVPTFLCTFATVLFMGMALTSANYHLEDYTSLN
jgi:hypothetical protein